MIPNPWLIVGALIGSILLFAAGAGTGSHFTALSYKAAIAKQDATASQLLAQLTATAAAKDAQSSEFARNLDEVRNHEVQTVAAARSDFDRALADKLRNPSSRSSCPSPGAAKAPDSINSERVEDTGIILHEQALRDLGALMQEADELVATMGVCRAWAQSVGR